ncbi:MAG: hypothetical protein IPL03_12040 [Sterolibacteriaceae bacterium]|nr:hypothetical protein [Candidatus Methylophosphatis haderslevensis]
MANRAFQQADAPPQSCFFTQLSALLGNHASGSSPDSAAEQAEGRKSLCERIRLLPNSNRMVAPANNNGMSNGLATLRPKPSRRPFEGQNLGRKKPKHRRHTNKKAMLARSEHRLFQCLQPTEVNQKA